MPKEEEKAAVVAEEATVVEKEEKPEEKGDFLSLCNDLILEVFKYCTTTEKTRYERVNSRLGEILPFINQIDKFDWPDHNTLEFRNVESSYMRMVQKYNLTKKGKTIDFEFLRIGYSTIEILTRKVTPDEYLSNWAALCENLEQIKLLIQSDSDWKAFVVVEILRRLKEPNQVKRMDLKLNIDVLDESWSAAEKLAEIIDLCPELEDLELNFYGYREESSGDVYRRTREGYEKFWTAIGNRKIKTLDIDYYKFPGPLLGVNHWMARSFEHLEKLYARMTLSNGLIACMPDNMKLIKDLQVITEDFNSLESFMQLEHLEILNWEYFNEESTFQQKRRNKVLFNRFLKRRGNQLKELTLEIPFQEEEFFKHVPKLCPNLKLVILDLLGVNFTRFNVKSVISLPNLRRLCLNCKLSTDEVREILANCPKLYRLDFSIPLYGQEEIPVLIELITNYRNSHANTFKSEITFCGNASRYANYKQEGEGRFSLRIDDKSAANNANWQKDRPIERD